MIRAIVTIDFEDEDVQSIRERFDISSYKSNADVIDDYLFGVLQNEIDDGDFQIQQIQENGQNMILHLTKGTMVELMD